MAFRLIPKISCEISLNQIRLRSFSVDSAGALLLKSNVDHSTPLESNGKCGVHNSVRRRAYSQPATPLRRKKVEMSNSRRLYSQEIKNDAEKGQNRDNESDEKPMQMQLKHENKSKTLMGRNATGVAEAERKGTSDAVQAVKTVVFAKEEEPLKEKFEPLRAPELSLTVQRVEKPTVDVEFEEEEEKPTFIKNRRSPRFALADSTIRSRGEIEKEIQELRERMKQQILSNNLNQNSQKQVLRLQEVADELLVKEKQAKKSRALYKLPNLIEQYKLKSKMKYFAHTNLQPQNLSPFNSVGTTNSGNPPGYKLNSKLGHPTHRFRMSKSTTTKSNKSSTNLKDQRYYSTRRNSEDLQEFNDIIEQHKMLDPHYKSRSQNFVAGSWEEQEFIKETMDFINQFKESNPGSTALQSGFIDPFNLSKDLLRKGTEPKSSQDDADNGIFEEVFIDGFEKNNSKPLRVQTATAADHSDAFVRIDLEKDKEEVDVLRRDNGKRRNKKMQLAKVRVKEDGKVEVAEDVAGRTAKRESMAQINRILSNLRSHQANVNKKLEICSKQGSLQISDIDRENLTVEQAKKRGQVPFTSCSSYSDTMKKKVHGKKIQGSTRGDVEQQTENDYLVSLKIFPSNSVGTELQSNAYQNPDNSSDYTGRKKVLNIGKRRDSYRILTKKLSRSVTNFTNTSTSRNFTSCTQIIANVLYKMKMENLPSFKDFEMNEDFMYIKNEPALYSDIYEFNENSTFHTKHNSNCGSNLDYPARKSFSESVRNIFSSYSHILSGVNASRTQDAKLFCRNYSTSVTNNLGENILGNCTRKCTVTQGKRFKHGKKQKKDKCKPKKKKTKKAKEAQICAPYDSPNPDCLCVKPKIPDILPKLKRLPKLPKKDINWDDKNCSRKHCEWEKDDRKEFKDLPPPPLSSCLCVEMPVPDKLPRLRRLPKFMREDLCWEDICVTKSHCKDAVRADEQRKKKRKRLPPLRNSKCPPNCPKLADVNPKLKRLPKKDLKDPDRICVRKEKECPPRADDSRGFKAHRLPKPPINKCPPPCIPTPSGSPQLRRLKKVRIKERRECPVLDECDETIRADYRLKVKKKILPCLLPALKPCANVCEKKPKCPPKPKKKSKSKKSFSTLASSVSWDPIRRFFSTGSALYKYTKKCEDISLPCCEKATDKSCVRRTIMPDCCKEDAPYPSFSECGERKTESFISHCEPQNYLQPKRPILPNVSVSQAPPPVHAPIDPEMEEECVRERLNYTYKQGTRNCEDFYDEEPPLLDSKFLKQKELEAIAEGNVGKPFCPSKAARGKRDPHVCPVVDTSLCEGLNPVLCVDIPDKPEDYLSCKSKKEKTSEEETCAERTVNKCMANEYPSPKVAEKVAAAKCKPKPKAKSKAGKPKKEATQHALIPLPGGKLKNASFSQTLWERLKSFLRAKPNCPRQEDKRHMTDCVQYSMQTKKCGDTVECVDECAEEKKPTPTPPTSKKCCAATQEKSKKCKKASEPEEAKKKAADEKKSARCKATTTSAKDVPDGSNVAEICIEPPQKDEKEEEAAEESPYDGVCPRFKLPNCPPRKVLSCKHRSEYPKCKVQEAPYVSFSECHMFKKLRLNEKQIADMRARMTKKTFEQMQKNRCFSTAAGNSRDFSSKSNIFDYLRFVSEENGQEMDDHQLAEKLLDCIKDGLDALEKDNSGVNHPMYNVYKELEMITTEELKQCERYLKVQEKEKSGPGDKGSRENVTFSCKLE